MSLLLPVAVAGQPAEHGAVAAVGAPLADINPIEATPHASTATPVLPDKAKTSILNSSLKKKAFIAIFSVQFGTKLCDAILNVVFVTTMWCIKCPLDFISSLSACSESWVIRSRTPNSDTAWPSAITPASARHWHLWMKWVYRTESWYNLPPVCLLQLSSDPSSGRKYLLHA